MTPADWWSVAVIAMAALVGGLIVCRIRRGTQKLGAKYFSLVMCAYFIALYTAALFTDVYIIRSGIMGRLGTILLLSALAAETIMDDGGEKCQRK